MNVHRDSCTRGAVPFRQLLRASVALVLFGCGGGGAADGVAAPAGGSTPTFTSLTLVPESTSVAIGATTALTTTALDQHGQPISGLPQPAWSTSDAVVASVTASGVVTGVSAGAALITASLTSGSVTKSAAGRIVVSSGAAGGPISATITTPGTSFAPSTLTVAEGATVTWNFSGATHNVFFTGAAPPAGNIPDQSIGSSVSRTFPASGTFAYECTRHNGMTGVVIVTGAAAAVFTSVGLTPSTPSLPAGGTLQLTAVALDQNGSAMPGAAAEFTSSNTTVATVSSSGFVTGVAAGSATLTANITFGGVTKSGTAVVTVTAPPAVGGGSATVTTPDDAFSPRAVTIIAGGSVTWQFSETTHNVTFSGAAPPGGSIPNQQPGNAVTRSFPTAGSYSYECTRHSGMTGTVQVQPPSGGGSGSYSSLSLSPPTTSVGIAQTVQLTATPLDQNGLPLTGLSAATFSSSSTTTATVSAAGLVTGVAVGTATITASLVHAGVTRTATSTVTVTSQPNGSAIVTTDGDEFEPDDISIAPGGTVTWQFTSGPCNVTFTKLVPPGGNIPTAPQGTSVSRTFPASGDYVYECTLEKGMKARVRVR